MSDFGETKSYVFGKITDTRANHIRVVRVFDKIFYERVGHSRRFFKKFKMSKSDFSDFIGKLISTGLVLILLFPLFIVFIIAFIVHIWKFEPEE